VEEGIKSAAKMQTIDLFNTVTAESKYPCIQYIADNGKVAKRGYWSGGIHIWENLTSKGMEHMCVGPVPTESSKVAANGLRVGVPTREYDELKAGVVTLTKVQGHWNSTPLDQPYLKDVDWAHGVVCTRELIIDRNNYLQLLTDKIPEESTAVYYNVGKELAKVFKDARLWLTWFSDVDRALLHFDTPAMGGVILSWDCKEGGKEIFDATWMGTPCRLVREGARLILEKDETMRVKRVEEPKEEGITIKTPAGTVTIPKIPMAPAAESKEKAEEKAEKLVTKEEPETPDLPGVPEPEEVFPAPKERPKKPFDGLDLEELLEAMEESIGKMKEALQPMLQILRAISKETKNSASSADLKALKAENKELTSKVKQLEKEVASKKAALQALVNGKDF